MPFFPVWLIDRGLSATLVGHLFTLTNLSKLFTNPLFAYISDKWFGPRRVIQALLIPVVIGYCFYWAISGAVATFLIAILISLFITSIYPLSEAYAALFANRHRDQLTIPTKRPITFGRIRMWGSAGFGIAAVVAGYFGFGDHHDLFLGAVIVILIGCTIAAFSLPKISIANERDTMEKSPFKQLLADCQVLSVIVGASLIQASNGYFYTFSVIYWTGAGLTFTQSGILWGIGIVSEIFFFQIGITPFRGLKPLHILIICALFTSLRWIVFGSVVSFEILCFAQSLQGLTIGTSRSALIAYLQDNTSDASMSSSISLFALLGGGVLMSVSITMSSQISNIYNLSGYYVMTVIALAALPFLMPRAAGTRRLNHRDE